MKKYRKVWISVLSGSCVLVAVAMLSQSADTSVLKVAPRFARSTHPMPVTGQSSTLLPDGHLLLLGGNGPSGALDIAEIKDPKSGAITSLDAKLNHARFGHTATMLPDGSVLIFGGIGKDGAVVVTGELFDPRAGVFKNVSLQGLTSSAYHSATVLTDGRVLFAGGVDSKGETLDRLELWDYRKETAVRSTSLLLEARSGHIAILLADGSVLFWGGINRSELQLNYGEVFDPRSESIRIQVSPSQPASNQEPASLSESMPTDGAKDVPLNAVIALRFSKPLDVETINSSTLVLSSEAGTVDAKVIPAESGMLAFITPKIALESGTDYSVSVSGVTENDERATSNVTLLFTTANPADSGITSGALGTGNGSESGADPLNSSWRKLPPLKAAPGVTALAGQVLTLDGEPLSKVTLEVEGGDSARTDKTGRFLVERLTPGHHVIWIDGETANSKDKTYGLFEVGVDIAASQTNVLNYTIWMPVLDMEHAVTVPFPTQTEVVVKSPLLSGLELHIPPQTRILDRNGKTVDKISITPIPVNQPPFPLPDRVSVPLYFTIQPGGAYVKVDDPSGPQGARLFYPNSGHRPAGAVSNFWDYDADEKGWFVYGQGTVSTDQFQVIPAPGVVIYEFTGAMVSTGFGPPIGPKPGNPEDGDPVDLGTGLFVYNKTDLVEPDVIPIMLTRTYRQMGNAGDFGNGWMHPYDIFLEGANNYSDGGYTYLDLRLPDGGRVHFDRTSPCNGTNGHCDYANAVYTCTTPNSFFGATIQWISSWLLTKKDGTIMVFPESDWPNAIDFQGAAITAMQDRYGNTLTFTRDSNKNLTKITSPNGRWIQFTIDPTHYWVTQASDQAGRTVQYSYDANGRLSTVTDANNGLTTYTYDSNNNLNTIKDARQIVYLTNFYDANNRVYKQVQADSSTFLYSYTTDANNNVTQTNVTDPKGNIRQVTFNSDGYVISDASALGKPEQQTITYSRQPGSNLVLSMTDALTRQTTYSYDVLGNVTSMTRLAPNGVTTRFAYEPSYNQLSAITDPLGQTTTLTYDTHGNLVSITDPMGSTSYSSFNDAGQVLSVTDPLGSATQFSYESGDLVSITDPQGRSTLRFIDLAGRLASVTDPLGRITRYVYNALNQVTSEVDPSGSMTSFGYDPNGNLTSVTDANNHTTQFVFDNMDRASTRKDALLNQESYQYDPNGNLSQFTDRRSKVTTYNFDGLDRLTLAGYGMVSGPAYESTVGYTYDAGNRPKQTVDSLSGTIMRTYDDLDRLKSETTPQGVVNYTYDNGGRRASMTVQGQAPVTYTFDNSNRLGQIMQGSSTVQFTYDNGNRRTTMTLPNGIVASYTYDTTSQLTALVYSKGSTPIGGLAYGYDAAGHRTSLSGTLAAINLPLAVSVTGYNANNQLTGWGTANLFYDLNGNMTSDGTHSFTWDARNRLKQIDNGSTASFLYDPFGRRVNKTVLGTSTSFLYDGVNLVQEISGVTPIANLLTGGLDENFSRTDSSGTSSFLRDALGSTLALTDSSGVSQTSYTYDPFGTSTVSGAGSTNSFAYAGREMDATGLYFNRARYYNPKIQRFVSEDPFGLAGGDLSLYAYAGNGPVNSADPFGLSKYLIIVGEGGFPGGHHNAGGEFDLVAATAAAELKAAGDTVVIQDVSTVEGFNSALNGNGTIDGGVIYFGHAAEFDYDNAKYGGLVLGGATGEATNLTPLNVNRISGAHLGPDTTITLNGCNAGFDPGNGSIAQAIANQLRRDVIAYKVPMFFGGRQCPRNSGGPGSKGPSKTPVHMCPEGGGAPTTFKPQ